MDENQIIDNIHDENSNLYLTKEAREYLYKTSNWAMGFAILGFLGVGMGILGGFSFIAMGVTQQSSNAPSPLLGDTLPIIGIVYLIFTLIFALPVWKHFKFAQKAKDSARREDSASLTEAMKNLHGYYKWYGLLIIISIILYFIMLFTMLNATAEVANGFQF